MISSKSLLEDYIKEDGPTVTFINNGKGLNNGHGVLKCKSVKFSNVSYVKDLKHNLISISQICNARYEVHFNKRERDIIHSKKGIVLTTEICDDIYILDIFSIDTSMKKCFFSRTLSYLK